MVQINNLPLTLRVVSSDTGEEAPLAASWKAGPTAESLLMEPGGSRSLTVVVSNPNAKDYRVIDANYRTTDAALTSVLSAIGLNSAVHVGKNGSADQSKECEVVVTFSNDAPPGREIVGTVELVVQEV